MVRNIARMDSDRDLIEQIENRASAVGMSVNELCKRARVARSTFTRWKAGAHAPQMRVYRKLLAALDDARAA